MKKFFWGMVIGIFLPPIGGYIFIISGGMPVAAKGVPLPMERFIAKLAIDRAMKDDITRRSPLSSDEMNLLAGAKIYVKHCDVCHGLSANQPTFISKGLFPRPPQFFEPNQGLTEDPIGEVFWSVKNGMRLTGMPGFDESLSETEIWQVSQFLLSADKLPPSAQQVLTSEKL